MVDIHNGYEFRTPIVGESHYTETLRQCYDDPNAYRKGQAVFIDVQLFKDNNNPYDNQAVAVISAYGKVGHLSRKNARKYRKDYDQDLLSVRAKIVTRTGELFGVWVDLEYDDDTPAQTPKAKTTTKSTTKKSSSSLSPKSKSHKKGLLARLLGL